MEQSQLSVAKWTLDEMQCMWRSKDLIAEKNHEKNSSRCMNQAGCSDFQNPGNGSVRCECFYN